KPQVPSPAVVVVAPAAGATVASADVRLKIQVKSAARIAALRIAREDDAAEQTFAPPAKAKPGEVWTLEPVVFLNEGENRFRLEAVDEHGGRGQRTVTITRRSLVALDLRGPPGAQVKVNEDTHTLDASGDLTLQLPPGTYRLEGTKDGFKDARDTVTLAPGQGRARKSLAMAAIPAPPPPPVVVAPPADTETPKIAINYPGVDAKVEGESIVVLGLVTDNVAVDRVQVTVNGVELAQPRELGVVGRGVPIRVPAPLVPGPNVIEITAADKAGNVSQIVRTVVRAAPVVAAPTPPPGPKVANRWAVVIGVGEYEHRTIPKLRYATKDAEAVYQFLTTQGGYPKENVLLLTDTTAQKPTLVNIKRALGDFLARRAGRDDMVLIYFAGHGAPEVDAGGIEADGLSKYLIPRDGDPDSLYTSALPMDEIQRIFARVQAERIVMLLDTCYSGTAGGRTFARASTRATGINDQFLERLTRSRGRVIITASGPNEVALELPELGHGVFTHFVLEGLRGKADRNKDSLVTVSELYEYVEDQVDATARRAGGRQRPLMKGEIEGTLPLSRVSK
ncbi:MAG TPA: caspase family protein, partial [Terriglobales bacterium]|nr:caspase family protein [Terriglobales bacterium]